MREYTSHMLALKLVPLLKLWRHAVSIGATTVRSGLARLTNSGRYTATYTNYYRVKLTSIGLELSDFI